jgi:hypothetical protein
MNENGFPSDEFSREAGAREVREPEREAQPTTLQ